MVRSGVPERVAMMISGQFVKIIKAPVAQGIEHRIPNPCAAGSNPAGGTNKNNGLHRLMQPLAIWEGIFAPILPLIIQVIKTPVSSKCQSNVDPSYRS